MAVDPAAHRASEDLTARARIRDAALRLFAERGIGAATIRDIAKQAGVSSGLVRHHFGSKEALRDACDAYATERLNRLREQMFLEGGLADTGFMSAVHPTATLLQRYLVRSALDGSEKAASMFDDMVELGKQWLALGHIESRDPVASAAVLVVMQLGVFAMPDLMSRALGVDVRTPEGSMRMMRGFVDIFSHPLLTPEQAAQLHAGMDRVQQQHQPESGTQGAAGTKG
jgi:TetR/AcrR family transcriptional regulator, regulator of cefoperazone and chloramphenicol sensitivity